MAAIADALHSANTYKGKGGEKGKGKQTTWQGGRNCPSCNDYNFEHRILCRQCGTKLPPPTWTEVPYGASAGGGKEKGAAAGGKGWQKGGGGNFKGGDGGGNNLGKGVPPAAYQTAPPPTTAAAGGASSEDGANTHKEPSERVKEIRAEEERLRRARSQFSDTNPRMLATIDDELAQLSAERETLQPLEVNLQAAAGKTAHARAALAKAREKRDQAARDLKAKIDAYKDVEREVKDAEDKLRAAEAAATAKRCETVGGVQEAVSLLQKVAAEKCGEGPVAEQVATALLQIAKLLGTNTEQGGDGPEKGGGSLETGAENGGKGADAQPRPPAAPGGDARHDNKKLRTSPPQQNPADATGKPPALDGGADKQLGDGESQVYAGGGTVDGEITMGGGGCGKHGRGPEDDLLAEAEAVLADPEDKEL